MLEIFGEVGYMFEVHIKSGNEKNIKPTDQIMEVM